MNLPAYHHVTNICDILSQDRIAIVSGDTGSGKSTVLPNEISKRLGLRVVSVQPRNIAARSLAEYTGSGCWVGGHKSNVDSSVIYMTNGTYMNVHKTIEHDCLIIDEVHERSVQCDIIMAYSKIRLQTDPNFKLVICSATFCIQDMLDYFGCSDNNFVQIDGRLFQTRVYYAPPENAVIDMRRHIFESNGTKICKHLHHALDDGRMKEGNVLVFDAGVDMVEALATDISYNLQKYPSLKYKVSRLHGQLEVEEQQQVLNSADLQIIVTTNIAETSLTVHNVTCVIDLGYEKNMLQSQSDICSSDLQLERISKSSAIQRTGRAGRVRDGICIRMYGEDEYLKFRDSRLPEILTCNLATTILGLYTNNIDIWNLPLLSTPDSKVIDINEKQLMWYGALDTNKKVTALGKFLCSINVSVPYAFALYRAKELFGTDMMETIAVLISMISGGQSPFYSSPKTRGLRGSEDPIYMVMQEFCDKTVPLSEHMMYINIFRYCQDHQFNHKDLLSKNLFVKTMTKVHDTYNNICRTLKLERAKNECSWEDIFACLYPSFTNKFVRHEYSRVYVDNSLEYSLHPSCLIAKHQFAGNWSDTPKVLFYSSLRHTSQNFINICSPVPNIEYGTVDPKSLIGLTTRKIVTTLEKEPFYPSMKPHVLNYDMFMVLVSVIGDTVVKEETELVE